MAWMRQGDILLSLGREFEGFSAYTRAFESAKARPLTRREDLRFRSCSLVMRPDYGEAEKLFSEYAFLLSKLNFMAPFIAPIRFCC